MFEVPYEGGTPAVWFSNDGTMLLVRLATGVMRVFGLADGAETTRFTASRDVGSVAMPEGNRQVLLVENASEGPPRLYSRQLQHTDLSASVCSRVGRNLTLDEWTQYFGDEAYERSCRNLPCPSGAQPKGANRGVRE